MTDRFLTPRALAADMVRVAKRNQGVRDEDIARATGKPGHQVKHWPAADRPCGPRLEDLIRLIDAQPEFARDIINRLSLRLGCECRSPSADRPDARFRRLAVALRSCANEATEISGET